MTSFDEKRQPQFRDTIAAHLAAQVEFPALEDEAMGGIVPSEKNGVFSGKNAGLGHL